MDSMGKAVKASLSEAAKQIKQTRKQKKMGRTGVETLQYRYEHRLDLWTGQPLESEVNNNGRDKKT